MKKIFSSTFAFFLWVAAYSQYSFTNANSQQVMKRVDGIATDNSGNRIITGLFDNTITFGTYTLTSGLPAAGATNAAYIAKLSPGGTFLWAKAIKLQAIPNNSTGTSYVQINGVTTDGQGNICFTGIFRGKIAIDNNTLSSTKIGSEFTTDMVTGKLTSSGTFSWWKLEGTKNDGYCGYIKEPGASVSVDAEGNVLATGAQVVTTLKFATGCNFYCPNVNTKPIMCIYVVKYGPTGTKKWEKKFYNPQTSPGISCIVFPKSYNVLCGGTDVYLIGLLYGTVSFGNFSLNSGNEATPHTFITKLDKDGNVIWAKQITDNANFPYVGDNLYLDNNNADLYINGFFTYGAISLGTCTLPIESGNSSNYLIKINTANGDCVWAVNPGCLPYGVVRNPAGNLSVLGRWGGVQSGWFRINEISPLDGSIIDSTFAPLDDTVTATMVGYTGLAKTPNGFVYAQNVQGYYNFGSLTVNSSQPKGSLYSDFIIMEYTSPAPPIARGGKNISETTLDKVIIYPNPAINQINIRNNYNKLLGTVSIYDVSGKMIYKNFIGSSQAVIDLKSFSSGVYYLRSDQMEKAIKFVKQ